MLRLIGTLALSCAALSAADHGWHSLFDGKTFDHWQQAPSFIIEDGCLKSVAHPRITEDLFSKETFGDFELEFDWKISPKGNSGVKYRIQDHLWVLEDNTPRFEDKVNGAFQRRRTDRPDHGQDYVIGFEYQITDNQQNIDALRNGPLHRTAALYDMFAATKDVTRPVGEFNHTRIVVKGDHFEHWLNGEKVLEGSLKAPEIAAAAAERWGAGSPVYDLLVKQPRKQCPISLQNHGDEAWFKNIRVRRLD